MGLTAREVYDINNDWRFYFRHENSADNARYVNLPHTFSLDAKDEALYIKRLLVGDEFQGKRLFLRFGGVQKVAALFVNGKYVGEHKGGYTAFCYEITSFVTYGQENIIVLSVINNDRNDVLPLSSELNEYGGIYRGVELIATSQNAISPTYYATDGVFVHQKYVGTDKVQGEVEVALSAPQNREYTLEVDFVSPDGYSALNKVVKVKYDGKNVRIPYTINDPELWSLSKPSLYQVKVTLNDEDNVSVNVGFRSVTCSSQEGVEINGKRRYLKGVEIAHERLYKDSALEAEDYLKDIQLISDLGANAIRSLGGPHDSILYNECDKRGIAVWIDIPFTHSPFLSDICYFPTKEFKDNAMLQLKEIILQNYNHPSVVMWGIFSKLRNCSPDIINIVKTLNAESKKIDPARPTVACSCSDGDVNFITDLIVWKQNVGWNSGKTEDLLIWQDVLRKQWNHLCQGVSFGEGGTVENRGNIAMRRSSDTPAGISEWEQTRFMEDYARYIDQEFFWGAWISTMFDFGANRYPNCVRNTGLVAFDHNRLKDSYYLYKMLWNPDKPTLYITGKNHPVRNHSNQVIKVYSSVGQPVLTINDVETPLTEQQPGIFVTEMLQLKGENDIKVRAYSLSDSMTLIIGNRLKK